MHKQHGFNLIQLLSIVTIFGIMGTVAVAIWGPSKPQGKCAASYSHQS